MWLFFILQVRQCQVKCAAATVLLRRNNWLLNFSWRQTWKELRCVSSFSHVTMHVLMLCPFKIASNLRSVWQLLIWSSTVRSTDAATLCSQPSLHHPTLIKRKKPACCWLPSRNDNCLDLQNVSESYKTCFTAWQLIHRLPNLFTFTYISSF